jgi:hypothetical protein
LWSPERTTFWAPVKSDKQAEREEALDGEWYAPRNVVLPVEDAVTQPGGTHIADDQDDSVQLNERATKIWWDDFGHPDWDCCKDHESAGACKEAEHQKHGHVHAAC